MCEKSDENGNSVDGCDGPKKSNFIKKVKMIKIAQNVMMPQVGYGTWKVIGDDPIYKVDNCDSFNALSESVQALEAALDSGYRLIDTAVVYGNHRYSFQYRWIIFVLWTCLMEQNHPSKTYIW